MNAVYYVAYRQNGEYRYFGLLSDFTLSAEGSGDDDSGAKADLFAQLTSLAQAFVDQCKDSGMSVPQPSSKDSVTRAWAGWEIGQVSVRL